MAMIVLIFSSSLLNQNPMSKNEGTTNLKTNFKPESNQLQKNELNSKYEVLIVKSESNVSKQNNVLMTHEV